MIGKSSAEQQQSIELASKKKNFFVVQVVLAWGGRPTWLSIWVNRTPEVMVVLTFQRMLAATLVDTIPESHTGLEAAYAGEMMAVVHHSVAALNGC